MSLILSSTAELNPLPSSPTPLPLPSSQSSTSRPSPTSDTRRPNALNPPRFPQIPRATLPFPYVPMPCIITDHHLPYLDPDQHHQIRPPHLRTPPPPSLFAGLPLPYRTATRSPSLHRPPAWCLPPNICCLRLPAAAPLADRCLADRRIPVPHHRPAHCPVAQPFPRLAFLSVNVLQPTPSPPLASLLPSLPQ